jgi:four helix bundle protein
MYALTNNFPKEEIYGLTSQIRRAASSIPANIAEGWSRSTKEYLKHLMIAQGSLRELETHLTISQRVNFIHEEKLKALIQSTDTLGRMLNKLQQSLKSNPLPRPQPPISSP